MNRPRAPLAGGMLLALILGLYGPGALAQSDSDASVSGAAPPRIAIWTEPLLVTLFGAAGDVYVPLGVTVPLWDHVDLLVEGTFTRAIWYPCHAISTGGWLEGGLAFRDRNGTRGTGLYWAPKLLARWFTTSGGRLESQPLPGDACTEAGLSSLRRTDGELHVGADIGWIFARDGLYGSLSVGAHVGPCFNCLHGVFFWGHLTPFNSGTARSTRISLGVNISIIQLGVAF